MRTSWQGHLGHIYNYLYYLFQSSSFSFFGLLVSLLLSFGTFFLFFFLLFFSSIAGRPVSPFSFKQESSCPFNARSEHRYLENIINIILLGPKTVQRFFTRKKKF